MKAWAGKTENVAEAQKLLVQRAHLNRLARQGEYSARLEKL
jgi:fructose-bisphosphate aldolase class I